MPKQFAFTPDRACAALVATALGDESLNWLAPESAALTIDTPTITLGKQTKTSFWSDGQFSRRPAKLGGMPRL
jgi:hypothetical protein